MSIFYIIGILTSLAATLAYLNYRFVKLPTTSGLMLLSMIGSAGLIGAANLGLPIEAPVLSFVRSIDFTGLLLEGILSFLVFAGALFLDWEILRRVKLDVAVLAFVGVLASTFMVAYMVYGLSHLFDLRLNFIYCLLFGALISPTDPVAVVATLEEAGVSERLHARIAGEALFNDGIGIALFITFVRLAEGQTGVTAGNSAILFVRESFGGLGLGLLVGLAGFVLLRSVDNYPLEILLTLGMVTGGYSLASVIEVSGPLSMVSAGLLTGHSGRRLAMSENTRLNLDNFWSLVEEYLNAVLFVLIGLEILRIFPLLTWNHFEAGLLVIVAVLVARFLSVAGLVKLLELHSEFTPHSIRLLTWSGVRGGISIALALSLPQGHARVFLLLATYMVAVFSLLVQSTTVKRLLPTEK